MSNRVLLPGRRVTVACTKVNAAASVWRSFATIVMASVVWLLTNTAHAELPPVSQDELQRDSDLIIEVTVQSVSKVRTANGSVWLAWLQVHRTEKGEHPSSPMPYRFVPQEPGIVGGMNASVFAGQHLRMHLIREQDGRLQPWASNCLEPIDQFDPQRYVLPDKVGETIYANVSRRLAGESQRVCGMRVRKPGRRCTK